MLIGYRGILEKIPRIVVSKNNFRRSNNAGYI